MGLFLILGAALLGLHTLPLFARFPDQIHRSALNQLQTIRTETRIAQLRSRSEMFRNRFERVRALRSENRQYVSQSDFEKYKFEFESSQMDVVAEELELDRQAIEKKLSMLSSQATTTRIQFLGQLWEKKSAIAEVRFNQAVASHTLAKNSHNRLTALRAENHQYVSDSDFDFSVNRLRQATLFRQQSEKEWILSKQVRNHFSKNDQMISRES